MGYLDNTGLSHFTEWVKSKLSVKQNQLTPDDTIEIGNDIIGVKTPVKTIITQEEFDALPESDKNNGLYVIPGSGSGSGSSSGGGIPSGCILIWSGTEDNVPDGWHICDGTENTPDLRGRFVLGVNENHEYGSSGGSEEVTLGITHMPAHNHRIRIYNQNSSSSGAGESIKADNILTSITTSYSPKFVAEPSGDSKPHNNMPPYYALAYIMKL